MPILWGSSTLCGQNVYVYILKIQFNDVITSPIHKFLGNFSATLGLSSNFQPVEEFSVHRATFKFLCHDRRSHAPATSETIKKCRI